MNKQLAYLTHFYECSLFKLNKINIKNPPKMLLGWPGSILVIISHSEKEENRWIHILKNVGPNFKSDIESLMDEHFWKLPCTLR